MGDADDIELQQRLAVATDRKNATAVAALVGAKLASQPGAQKAAATLAAASLSAAAKAGQILEADEVQQVALAAGGAVKQCAHSFMGGWQALEDVDWKEVRGEAVPWQLQPNHHW